MEILVDGVFAKILSASSTERAVLIKSLTYQVPRMKVVRYRRKMSWDTDERIFLFDDCFPSPLIPSLDSVRIIDQTRDIKPVGIDVPFKLIPIQERAVNEILKVKCAILQGPTGIGKTYMAGAIASAFKGRKVLYLVHSKSIADQTYRRFKEWFGECGRVYSGECDVQDLTVATFQSLRSLQLKADIVLIDECVHVVAPTYISTFVNTHAQRWYGFAASPTGRSDRLDSVTLQLFGNKIVKIELEEGFENQLLCPVEFYIIRYENRNYKIPSWRMTDSNWIYQTFVAVDDLRNRIIQQVSYSLTEHHQKVTLVLVHRMNHLKALSELIPEAVTISYKSSLEERRKCREMTSGIIIATRVVEEGIDNHNIHAIVNAACVRSRIAIIQRIGRGLRFEPGKKLLFFDVWDQYPPVLRAQGSERIRVYEKFGPVQILR